MGTKDISFLLTGILNQDVASRAEGAGEAVAIEETVATVGQVDTPAQTTETTSTFGGMVPMLAIYVVIFGAMWFLMIRPQRKRQKEQRDMLAALRVGDNIVTNAGLFGKITDIGEDVYVVEFGTIKGIRIPVLKSDVAGVREPKLTAVTHN